MTEKIVHETKQKELQVIASKKQQGLNEDDMVGPDPRKLQKLDLHELLLDNIPSSESYEISYMHKEFINNIIVSSKADVVITFSIDGHLKFWKKTFNLVEFTKNFKAHNGLITSAALSKNHDTLCTVGIDKTLKLFDVLNCDLRSVIKLQFSPSACEFIPRQKFDTQAIAVSQDKSGRIMIIDPQMHSMNQFNEDQDYQDNIQKIEETQSLKESQKNYEIIKTLNIHRHPIKFIKMNWHHGFCISIDERAFMEVWDPETFDFPKNTKYKCKIDTDFLQLISRNSMPIGLNISPKGKYVGIMLKDKMIRVFNLLTGKSVISINQSIKQITRIQQDPTHERHSQQVLEEADFQKKLGIEKDIEVSKQILNAPQLDFDQSEKFLIYPSFNGIKVYSIERQCVERILGKKQHERFIKTAIYQGRVMRNPSGSSNTSGSRKGADPTIFCTSFRKPRFYIFSVRNPEVGPDNDIIRDIINEKIHREQHHSHQQQAKIIETKHQATLHTTLGDISIELFLEDCPKTCENFLQLSKKGYYNGLIFHRVIKGFMNQTGCPKGDGTGGQSIWGETFEDQLCPQKHRFDRPYLLAMANRGPNTNGSQFFLTVVACPWLDNKHTVFGRVIRGIQTVVDINKLKTDKTERPLRNIKVVSVSVK